MTSESKHEYIGYKYYCGYCAKELEPKDHYEEYNHWQTVDCDCEGAMLEKQAKEIMRKANNLIKSKTLNELRYKEELRQLKHKFDIK